MIKNHFFTLLDEMPEVAPGTTKSGQVLADIPKWDFLALMGLMPRSMRWRSLHRRGHTHSSCH
jgi:hypothetical protein